MTLTDILLTGTITVGVFTVVGLIMMWGAIKRGGAGDASSAAEIARLKTELDRAHEDIGQLETKLKTVQSEKDELKGKNKGLYADKVELQASLRLATEKKEEAQKKLARMEADEEKREQEKNEALTKMSSSQKSHEEEKARIRKDDEERIKREEENRDRMWAEHEDNVISHLNDLCKKPQYAFTCYDKNSLPEEYFHGHFKPDFVIEFLDQFVVFDAKISKPTNVQSYVADQAKKTAAKAKGREKISTTMFLVIPTEVIKEVSKMSFYEEGFTFYVVSPESLEPILASLKKIEAYEFAQEMNPQERESIVDLIAQFDFHISYRNAAEYRLMMHGIDTLTKVHGLGEDLVKDVAMRKVKIRNLNLNTADQKKFTANPELLLQQLHQLTEPKAALPGEDIEKVGTGH